MDGDAFERFVFGLKAKFVASRMQSLGSLSRLGQSASARSRKRIGPEDLDAQGYGRSRSDHRLSLSLDEYW